MFHFWSGGFVSPGIDHFSLSVQRPKGVSENVGRVVPFLDFA